MVKIVAPAGVHVRVRIGDCSIRNLTREQAAPIATQSYKEDQEDRMSRMTTGLGARPRAVVSIDKVCASILVLLLPVREISPVASSLLSIGVLATLAIAVVPVVSARRYSYMGVLAAGVSAIVVSTPILWTFRGDRELNSADAYLGLATILVAAIHIIALLWARRFIGVRGIAALYSAGMLVQTILTIDSTSGNPWKFGLAFSVTIFLLAIVHEKHKVWSLVILLVVSVISLNQGYRSFLVFGVITILALLWASRRSSRPRRPWVEIVVIGTLAYLLYLTFVQLAVLGLLGERNQVVTSTQISAAGSALAGGRTENSAAFALFGHRPLGFGAGVLPNTRDLNIGSEALLSRGVNVEGTFVQDYLFGTGFKLHSVTADLWVNYGVAGLFVAGVIAWIILSGLARSLASQSVSALMIFLPVVGLWDMAFSPIGTNLWEVLLVMACLIPVKRMSEFPGLRRSGFAEPFDYGKYARNKGSTSKRHSKA